MSRWGRAKTIGGSLVVLVVALAIGWSVAALGAGPDSTAAKAGSVAPSAAGPRLMAIVVRGARTELLSVGPEGGDRRSALIGRSRYGRPPLPEHLVWSPDGQELAYFGPGDQTPAIYLVEADGSGLRVLRRSEHPGGPDDATVSEPLFDQAGNDVS